MRMKPVLTSKIVCLFLIALFCLFVNCKEQSEQNEPSVGNPGSNSEDDYSNPNAGASRDIKFSHNSGLYSQSFNLAITAAVGSSVYYSTDGSVPSPQKVGNGYVFKYSSPITVQNRNGQANVLASRANTEQFYMAPGDPRGSLPTVYYPSNNQVPKATVIRAVAVDSSGKQSDIITKTYFIGDNLANYGSNRVISLVSDPYNLTDEDYGIMVMGKPSNRWDSDPPYNYRRKGADWEREAYLELFEGNTSARSVPLSTGVGIRVRGGWSRGLGQKSFSVYFKEQYGINNLRNYNLIPGAVKADGKTPVERYKGFMLRNGANDCEYTKFYDVFIQELLNDRSFSTQASVPCVVYLNGEYWGPYNLQERYSDNHTEYKYGVKKENVISFDNGELDDGDAGEESLFWDMMDMAYNDMSDTANYNAFCDVFDIENFIDYWAAEIYIYNEDWPHNNYRLWRTRDAEPGNPYGDQKWRYQMFDTEFALGIYNGGGLTGQNRNADAFAKVMNGENKNHHNNKLFKALLANPDFCRKFVNTMMDLYNVNFHPDSYLPKLNSYTAAYRPLMDGYYARWGRPWDTVFQNKTDEAKNYLNDIRYAMVNNYLPAYFGGYSGVANIGVSAGNLRSLTLSATGVSGASIKINTVTPNLASGSWTGKYYSGNTVTVTASAAPAGYEFDGWTVTGGTAATPSALTTAVNIAGDAQIIAKYKLIGGVVVPVTGISLDKTSLNFKIGDTSTITATVTPSGATYKTVIWVSGNSSIASVNNGTVTAVNSGTTVITASTVEGVYAECSVTVREPTVLLDLAEKLQTLTPQLINTWDKFYAAFGGLPVTPGDDINDTASSRVSFRIIDDSGVKKLQVNVYVNWGSGLIVTNDAFTFKAGDLIEFKGKFINGPSNGIYVNTNCWGYDPLQGWNESFYDGQVIQKNFTLTASDAAAINANAVNCGGAAISFKSGGIPPWDGTVYPAGIGSFVIEQIKISRIE